MNEQELGKEIAKLLNFSADENIKQSTLYRLQSARRAALENCQPTLKIMNAGSGTSIYSEHDGYFNTGKLLLLLTVLFVFALVSTTYWQSLEKGKYAAIDDNAILADDSPTDTHIDNVLELVDDLLTDTRTENEPELADDLQADTRSDSELELADDLPTDAHIDNVHESVDDLPTDTPIDNELDKWLDSH